jgi:hypothetical protein
MTILTPSPLRRGRRPPCRHLRPGPSAPGPSAPGLALLGLVVLLLAGCGGSGVATRQAQQSFLGSLHDQIPDINLYRSDTSLVRLGDAACADFSSGASFEAVAEQLQLTDGNFPTAALGSLITTAAEDLCPKYRALVD